MHAFVPLAGGAGRCGTPSISKARSKNRDHDRGNRKEKEAEQAAKFALVTQPYHPSNLTVSFAQ